jgi:threonine/homoserine/homoserine lactone efflux protein
MSFELWLTFIAASTVLLLIPGPTVTLIVAYALGYGRAAALPLIPGVALGNLFAMTASLMGLGAILVTSATWFTALKWLGAAYLLYLAVQLWRTDPTAAVSVTRAAATPASIFRHGLVVTALNPKTIVFFVAFVPQFVDPGREFAPQAAILIATFVILSIVNDGAYALLATAAHSRIAQPSTLRFINRLGATALAGAAVLAAISRQTS